MNILIGVDNSTSYTFDASLKQVTLSGLPTIALEQVLLVVNTTTGDILYNFSDSSFPATIAANVITLTSDTTGMTDTDKLQKNVQSCLQTLNRLLSKK